MFPRTEACEGCEDVENMTQRKCMSALGGEEGEGCEIPQEMIIQRDETGV